MQESVYRKRGPRRTSVAIDAETDAVLDRIIAHHNRRAPKGEHAVKTRVLQSIIREEAKRLGV